MKVDVTQFLLPNGEQRKRIWELPGVIPEQVEKIRSCGARLTAEVLTTGEVSVCIEDEDIGDDFDIRVIPNGPAVPEATTTMINNFCVQAFETWKQDEEGGDDDQG